MIGLEATKTVNGWGICLDANFSTQPNQFGNFTAYCLGRDVTDELRTRDRMIWQAIQDAAFSERELNAHKRAGRFSHRHSQARECFCKMVAAKAEILLADPDWQAKYAHRQGAN